MTSALAIHLDNLYRLANGGILALTTDSDLERAHETARANRLYDVFLLHSGCRAFVGRLLYAMALIDKQSPIAEVLTHHALQGAYSAAHVVSGHLGKEVRITSSASTQQREMIDGLDSLCQITLARMYARDTDEISRQRPEGFHAIARQRGTYDLSLISEPKLRQLVGSLLFAMATIDLEKGVPVEIIEHALMGAFAGAAVAARFLRTSTT